MNGLIDHFEEQTGRRRPKERSRFNLMPIFQVYSNAAVNRLDQGSDALLLNDRDTKTTEFFF